MRKCAKYGLVTLLMFCFATSVKAEECSYEKQVELGKEASTVKAVYEEVQIDSGLKNYDEETGELTDTFYYHGFKVKILNLTENLFVRIQNGYDGSEKIYNYIDTNKGTIDLGEHLADDVYNIKISVFGAGNCGDTELRNISLTIPKYNSYSEYEVCKEYPDFQYCKPYVTSRSEIMPANFVNRLEEYKKSNKSVTEIKEQKEKEKNSNKIKEFFEKNKKVIVISVIAIAILGVATTTILIIRRRSRLI